MAATTTDQVIVSLAALLASDATSDMLFSAADALDRMAGEVELDGWWHAAGDLRALAFVAADEAARRRSAHAGVIRDWRNRHE
jgi:hypothetical protein